MWQEIAIGLIGLATIGYIGLRFYKTFIANRNTNDPCCGCKGCSLKELNIQKKQSRLFFK